jgi:ribosome-associated translation inhibitor RaiA
MQIQINTDHNVPSHAAMTARVSGIVENSLGRFSARITRVEVHLSDENGNKSSPNDKRCMMEARLKGRQPVAVSRQAATMDEALDGAGDKLARLLESALGRVHDQKRGKRGPSHPGSSLTEQS